MKLFAFIAAGAIASGVHASATVYTDEATFLGFVQAGYYVEDFDAFTYGSFTGPSLDFAQGPWAYTMSASNDLFSGDSNMSTNSAFDPLIIDFTGADVTAIGGFFFAGDFSGFFIPGQNMLLDFSDGTHYEYVPANDQDFVGFIFDVPITQMTINVEDLGTTAWPTVDHFIVGAAVPTPGVLALLGLAGLASRRRR